MYRRVIVICRSHLTITTEGISNIHRKVSCGEQGISNAEPRLTASGQARKGEVKTENGRQRTEDRRQRTDDRGRKTEDRGRKTEGGQRGNIEQGISNVEVKTEDGGQGPIKSGPAFLLSAISCGTAVRDLTTISR